MDNKQVSKFQSFKVALLLGFEVCWFLGFLVSCFVGFLISLFLGLKVQRYKSFKVPKFPKFKIHLMFFGRSFPFRVFWKMLIPHSIFSRSSKTDLSDSSVLVLSGNFQINSMSDIFIFHSSFKMSRDFS